MPDIESTSDASAAAFKPSDIKFDKIAAIPGVQAQARGQDASSRASDIYVDGNLIALKIARGRDYGGNFYYLFDTTADNPKKPLWDTGQAKQTFRSMKQVREAVSNTLISNTAPESTPETVAEKAPRKTTRERREARADKREEWAKSRERKAGETWEEFEAARKSTPPMGEPIKVGHHSEQRHRKSLKKVDDKLAKYGEHRTMQDKHEQAAGALRREVDRSIYSDDAGAITALQERIAESEKERERYKEINKLLRKAKVTDIEGNDHLFEDMGGLTEYERRGLAQGSHLTRRTGAILKWPVSSVTQKISTDRQRLERLQAERPAPPPSPRSAAPESTPEPTKTKPALPEDFDKYDYDSKMVVLLAQAVRKPGETDWIPADEAWRRTKELGYSFDPSRSAALKNPYGTPDGRWLSVLEDVIEDIDQDLAKHVETRPFRRRPPELPSNEDKDSPKRKSKSEPTKTSTASANDPDAHPESTPEPKEHDMQTSAPADNADLRTAVRAQTEWAEQQRDAAPRRTKEDRQARERLDEMVGLYGKLDSALKRNNADKALEAAEGITQRFESNYGMVVDHVSEGSVFMGSGNVAATAHKGLMTTVNTLRQRKGLEPANTARGSQDDRQTPVQKAEAKRAKARRGEVENQLHTNLFTNDPAVWEGISESDFWASRDVVWDPDKTKKQLTARQKAEALAEVAYVRTFRSGEALQMAGVSQAHAKLLSHDRLPPFVRDDAELIQAYEAAFEKKRRDIASGRDERFGSVEMTEGRKAEVIQRPDQLVSQGRKGASYSIAKQVNAAYEHRIFAMTAQELQEAGGKRAVRERVRAEIADEYRSMVAPDKEGVGVGRARTVINRQVADYPTEDPQHGTPLPKGYGLPPSPRSAAPESTPEPVAEKAPRKTPRERRAATDEHLASMAPPAPTPAPESTPEPVDVLLLQKAKDEAERREKYLADNPRPGRSKKAIEANERDKSEAAYYRMIVNAIERDDYRGALKTAEKMTSEYETELAPMANPLNRPPHERMLALVNGLRDELGMPHVAVYVSLAKAKRKRGSVPDAATTPLPRSDVGAPPSIKPAKAELVAAYQAFDATIEHQANMSRQDGIDGARAVQPAVRERIRSMEKAETAYLGATAGAALSNEQIKTLSAIRDESRSKDAAAPPKPTSEPKADADRSGIESLERLINLIPTREAYDERHRKAVKPYERWMADIGQEAADKQRAVLKEKLDSVKGDPTKPFTSRDEAKLSASTSRDRYEEYLRVMQEHKDGEHGKLTPFRKKAVDENINDAKILIEDMNRTMAALDIAPKHTQATPAPPKPEPTPAPAAASVMPTEAETPAAAKTEMKAAKATEKAQGRKLAKEEKKHAAVEKAHEKAAARVGKFPDNTGFADKLRAEQERLARSLDYLAVMREDLATSTKHVADIAGGLPTPTRAGPPPPIWGPPKDAELPGGSTRKPTEKNTYPEKAAFRWGATGYPVLDIDTGKVVYVKEKPEGVPSTSGPGSAGESYTVLSYDDDPPSQRDVDLGIVRGVAGKGIKFRPPRKNKKKRPAKRKRKR